MRKFAITLAAASLVLTSVALKADAQTRMGTAGFHALARNATPIHKVACGGNDAHCPSGSHWVCGPYGQRCWCTPC
jgi:hypothetical protein